MGWTISDVKDFYFQSALSSFIRSFHSESDNGEWICVVSVTTAKRHSQLVLKFLKVRKLPSHVDKVRWQSTPHGCAWLQMTAAKAQQTLNLAKFESQPLYATNESQSFNFTFAVLAEASRRSWCSR